MCPFQKIAKKSAKLLQPSVQAPLISEFTLFSRLSYGTYGVETPLYLLLWDGVWGELADEPPDGGLLLLDGLHHLSPGSAPVVYTGTV